MELCLESYEELKKKYMTNLEYDYDFYPVVFRKSCGYSILAYFNKKNSMNDIYKYIDLLFEGTTNKLFFKNDFSSVSLIKKSDSVLKDFILEKKIKPVYKVPTRIVYEFWLCDGYHNDIFE